MKSKLNYFNNIIFPAFVFASITGVMTALVVTLYTFFVHHAVEISESWYGYLKEHLYYVPLVLILLFAFSFLMGYVYKKMPDLKGDGIPTSIGLLRGVISFKWLYNLLGIFFMSLSSFLIGVPLGNEGIAVQMGTALGRGSVYPFRKKHGAWDRYAMTGGTCAGFSVATGAPISGIMFSLEEAHQRISPMIIMVSCTSVMFSYITCELLSSVFHVHTSLLSGVELIALSLKDIWIPVVVGIVMGLLAVLFLKYYRVMYSLVNKKLKKIPSSHKIFVIYALTVILGLVSFSFISTGHELIVELLKSRTAIYMLLLVLLVRCTMTLAANTTGITGGMHLPVLAIGAVLASIVGELLQKWIGFGEEYYLIILVLGIAACFAGMLKMPITAIMFSVEALGCHANILYVIVATAFAYIITEIFRVKSINENILDTKVEEYNEEKTHKVIDTFVTVQKGAFAIGKQIRDIFWPSNLFVLSLRHDDTKHAEVDEHGDKSIREGDILHVRYSTYDEDQTREELIAIVGDQIYNEAETDTI